MYSGENVVILNYSEWIIQLGLYICYFLLLVLSTKLYIHSPSKAPNYLSFQTNKSWESYYLVDLVLINKDQKCDSDYKQISLGQWSGITEYTCLCYNSDNIFFTTNKKGICKHNSEDNKYKNIFICNELDKIDSIILDTYNGYKFCGKYSKKKVITYHNNLNNKFLTNPSIDNYKSKTLSVEEKGIIDIKISKNKNLTIEGYEYKGNNLYIKKYDNNLLNIYEYNEFITDIHYANELICICEEMTNINPINNFYKNSRNVYYNNIKQCLRNKNQEYKYFYIDDNFIRTSIIDIDIDQSLNKKNEAYYDYTNIRDYYNKIKNNNKVDILENSNNYPILVAQKYLYGIGCQYYEKTNFYFVLFRHFYHNKNMALSIIIFSLATSITAVIYVSFNLYQSCIDYPLVYLSFSIILVVSLLTDLTLSGVYLGYCVYLKYYFGKILNECRIDYSGDSNKINKQNNYFNFHSSNKALPMEIGLYEDLDFVLYVSLVLVITEVVILILLIIYFAFNCYRYTFLALRNESGDIIKSRRRRKKDLMDLVKMI